MILPTSCVCNGNSYTVVPSRSTGVTVTASGCWTNPLTTYSRKACINPSRRSRGRGGCGCLCRPFDEAGHCFAGQRPFAHPIPGPIQVEGVIAPFLEGMLNAQF